MCLQRTIKFASSLTWSLARSRKYKMSGLHYPIVTKYPFSVQEEISVVVKQEVKEIVANAKDLKFSSAAIESNGKLRIIFLWNFVDCPPGSRQVATITVDEKTEKVTFAVPNPIKPGDAVIHASFTGELNDKLKGYFFPLFAQRRRYTFFPLLISVFQVLSQQVHREQGRSLHGRDSV